MIKEITTKMVEQTEVKYIADDGKVFTGDFAECDCIAYERRKDTERVRKEFEKLRPKYMYSGMIDWIDCEAEIFSVVLNDEVDVRVTLIDYLKVTGDGQWKDVDNIIENMPATFPCERVVINQYAYAGFFGDKEKLIADLERSIKTLKG